MEIVCGPSVLVVVNNRRNQRGENLQVGQPILQTSKRFDCNPWQMNNFPRKWPENRYRGYRAKAKFVSHPPQTSIYSFCAQILE